MRSASSGEQPRVSMSQARCRSAFERAMASAMRWGYPASTSCCSLQETTCCCTSSRSGGGAARPAMSLSYPASRRCANRRAGTTRGLQSGLVTDEADLLRAAAAASGRAQPGESVVAVLAAAPFFGPVLYLCALRAGPEDAPLSWVAFDEAGTPVTDERLIREAASLSALCETAEEASGALLAEEV